MFKYLKNSYLPLIAITLAALACNIPGSTTPTDTPAPPTDTVPIPSDTPDEPTETPFVGTGEACTFTAEGNVTANNRPSTSAEVFFEFGAGASETVSGQTADGWLGFDPAMAQGANIGPFRLRWVNSADVSTSGDCPLVEMVWGPPAGVCFLMPFDNVNVYTSADTSSTVVVSLTGAQDFAAITGITADRAWAQVDLGPGNTGLTDTGWIEGSALNMNGPCDTLPTVTP